MKKVLSFIRSPGRRRLLLMLASGALISASVAVGRVPGTGRASTVLLAAAALIGGMDIAVRAWQSLRVRSPGIELLVTIAAAGAIALGEYWEAAAVTFLFLFGAYLEARTLRRTRGVLGRLLDLAPLTVTVLRGGMEVRTRPEEVRPSESILVRPGERIAVDGHILSGASAINESSITGESIPVDKQEGDPVYAGTLNTDGVLTIRAARTGTDTTLARIIHRVEEAQEARAPTHRFIERFARWYTPAIILGSVILFILTRRIELTLTLLVISCPGALVVSTPVAIVAGIGRAAQKGILIKGGEHLERIGKVTALALDKTGTLTKAEPRLVDILSLGELPPAPVVNGAPAEQRLLAWAGVAESGSEHPLARPLVAAAEQAAARSLGGPADAGAHRGVLPRPTDFRAHPGNGVVAGYEGHQIVVGSARFLEQMGMTVPPAHKDRVDALARAGRTVILLGLDKTLGGAFGIADTIRPGAAQAVREIREAGVGRIAILTGDSSASAVDVARTVGITEVQAGLLPEQKLESIRRMRGDGEIVAMAGDGVNDAPALAAADVGIAMAAAGSGVAIETADVALMTDDLSKIPEAIRLSRATLRVIRQNLAIALITVGGLIAGVAAGRVDMAAGMLFHEASVLLVILNAMRLLRAGR
jgi:Cd2+/Zn2+-exporting ATPase